ncbi:MAG: hypothetical protein LBV45_07580 [Xanthomonadaceae bacterium]|jgi:hypothetical protein|nr:hypothetical protein [Xanthomonadaceae bacterium]
MRGFCLWLSTPCLLSIALTGVTAHAQESGDSLVSGYYQISVNSLMTFTNGKSVRTTTDGLTGDTAVTTSVSNSSVQRYKGERPVRWCVSTQNPPNFRQICADSLSRTGHADADAIDTMCPDADAPLMVRKLGGNQWEMQYQTDDLEQEKSVRALGSILGPEDLTQLQNAIDAASSSGEQSGASGGRAYFGLAVGVVSKIPAIAGAANASPKAGVRLESVQHWTRIADACPAE